MLRQHKVSGLQVDWRLHTFQRRLQHACGLFGSKRRMRDLLLRRQRAGSQFLFLSLGLICSFTSGIGLVFLSAALFAVPRMHAVSGGRISYFIESNFLLWHMTSIRSSETYGYQRRRSPAKCLAYSHCRRAVAVASKCVSISHSGKVIYYIPIYTNPLRIYTIAIASAARPVSLPVRIPASRGRSTIERWSRPSVSLKLRRSTSTSTPASNTVNGTVLRKRSRTN